MMNKEVMAKIERTAPRRDGEVQVRVGGGYLESYP